jgi:ABC-type transporter Mla MlaB component
VTALAMTAVRAARPAGPAFQWDPVRGTGAHTLRLFGRLDARDLTHVVDTLARHARAPRDLVWVDLSEVRHIDYRAIPDFARALLRLRERGAVVWLVGMSDYIRNLFGVAGEGPAFVRLTWNFGEDPAAPRRFPLERDRFAPVDPAGGGH